MSQIRTELIAPAVNFLKDPKVQISPIQKRVAFLESKGLTSEEIEEALRLTLISTKQLTTTTQTITNTPPQQITTLQVNKTNNNNSYRTPSIILRAPPPPPRLDWRDYFFVAILIGGTSYAIRVFVKKYILPYFKTLTKKNFNKDKQQLSNQFILTTKNLEIIKSDTQLTKKTIEEHLFKVKETLNTINKVLVNLCETDGKKDREITIVKLKSLSRSIPPSAFSSGETGERETIGSEQDSTPSWKLGMKNTSTTTKILVEQ
nr:11721_t:CDS:2 [Entrophospora candida]